MRWVEYCIFMCLCFRISWKTQVPVCPWHWKHTEDHVPIQLYIWRQSMFSYWFCGIQEPLVVTLASNCCRFHWRSKTRFAGPAQLGCTSHTFPSDNERGNDRTVPWKFSVHIFVFEHSPKKAWNYVSTNRDLPQTLFHYNKMTEPIRFRFCQLLSLKSSRTVQK